MTDIPETPPTMPEAQPVEGDAPLFDKPRFPWRLFWLLAAMMIAATLLLVPYAVRLGSATMPELSDNLPLVALSSIVQTVLLYWPAALVGLLVARRLELGAPYLAAIAERRPLPAGFRRGLIPAAVLGFGSGVVLLILAGVFTQLMPGDFAELSASMTPENSPNALEGFMASIAAGINEEILLRLFLLSLLAWVIQFVARRRTSGRPSPAILWAANVLAAVIFGLAHLPNLTMLGVPVTFGLLVYIITLNGLAGLGFGWLYWTFGLETAMLAHFFIDIVLHVITVPFTQLANTLK